jgi:V8-like Glu-specific endopeptidase
MGKHPLSAIVMGTATLLAVPAMNIGPRADAIVGAFEIPQPVPPAAGYAGVVQMTVDRGERSTVCSGTLLKDGRHILGAAHSFTDDDGKPNATSVTVHFDLPEGRKDYRVAPDQVIVHPKWNGQTTDGADIAIVRLPERAAGRSGPVRGFDIYTQTDEVGRTCRLMGYGQTGTGTTGEVDSDVAIQRLTITNATRGKVTLGFDGKERSVPFNASAERLEKVLRRLTDSDKLVVHRVENNDDRVRVFEIVFEDVDADEFPDDRVPTLAVKGSTDFDGRLAVRVLQQAGSDEVKRQAFNTFLKADRPDMLRAVLKREPGQGLFGKGDSGGPAFIGDRIAGVASNGDDGEFDDDNNWVRVSSYRDWIEKTISQRLPR